MQCTTHARTRAFVAHQTKQEYMRLHWRWRYLLISFLSPCFQHLCMSFGAFPFTHLVSFVVVVAFFSLLTTRKMNNDVSERSYDGKKSEREMNMQTPKHGKFGSQIPFILLMFSNFQQNSSSTYNETCWNGRRFVFYIMYIYIRYSIERSTVELFFGMKHVLFQITLSRKVSLHLFT